MEGSEEGKRTGERPSQMLQDWMMPDEDRKLEEDHMESGSTI